MITNLFSVFDPSSSLFSFAWILVLILPTLILTDIWNSQSPILTFSAKLISSLFNEISFTINVSNNSQELTLTLIFVIIILINFTALFPQVFSLTSHLTFTLPLSLLIWITIVSFGWLNNTSSMLSHLVPQGTPTALISFIVIIELVSNLIRPITLCVRLTANLIAGHLLMTLLGNSVISMSVSFSMLVIAAPLILTILETAVAFIQAYVFITLLTLYVTEIN